MGQHTRMVLKERLGLDEPALDRLAAKGLIDQGENDGGHGDFMDSKQ